MPDRGTGKQHRLCLLEDMDCCGIINVFPLWCMQRSWQRGRSMSCWLPFRWGFSISVVLYATLHFPVLQVVACPASLASELKYFQQMFQLCPHKCWLCPEHRSPPDLPHAGSKNYKTICWPVCHHLIEMIWGNQIHQRFCISARFSFFRSNPTPPHWGIHNLAV